MKRTTFFLILILGVILRVAALKSHDFWFDEALTYHFAKLDLANLLTVVASTDNNPPLHHILIHFLLKISSNEIFLRLPSLVASVLTIFVLWRLSPFASSLFSVSPLAIYISGETRLHALAALFAVLAYFSFLKVLNKNDLKNISSFVIISAVGIYIQYYVALLLVPFALITLARKRKLSGIILIPFILILPWLIFSFGFPHNGCWCPNTLISLPATLVAPMVAGVGIVTQRSFINLPLFTLTLFALTSIIFLFIFAKGIIKNPSLSTVYFIPLLILSIIGLFLPLFSPKGASIFTPFFFLICAQNFSQKSPNKLFLLLVTLLTSISLIQITSPFFKSEDLKTISQVLKTKNQDILHTSLATYYSQKYYLPQNQHFLITPNPLNQKTVDLIGGRESDLGNLDKIWLVDYPKWVDPNIYQTKKEQVSNLYQVQNEYKIDGLSVLDLKKK